MKKTSGSGTTERRCSFATPLAQLQHFDRKFRLGADIDAVLEACSAEQKDLADATAAVFKCLAQHLKPTLAFLRSFDEHLDMATFTYGCLRELLEQSVPDLFEIAEPTTRITPALTWFAVPLDMSGETVGVLGIAYQIGMEILPADHIFDLLDTVAEELDSYFFSIRDNRRKHLFILELQQALMSSIPATAVHAAATLLQREAPSQELLVIYREEDLIPPDGIRYVLFREGQQLFESCLAPHPVLSRIVQERPDELFQKPEQVLAGLFPDVHLSVFPMAGPSPEKPRGVIAATPLEESTLPVSVQDRLQLFAEALRQRLTDFNLEIHRLRRNFPSSSAVRLISTTGYQERFLVPRTIEVGRMAVTPPCPLDGPGADSKDQPLQVRLLHEWLCMATERIFEQGAALEPSSAGSLTALFGPPFFESSRRQTVERMVAAAIRLKSAWNELRTRPDFSALQTFRLAPRIAMTLETVYIDYIGPYHDIHAFPTGPDILPAMLSAIGPGDWICSSIVTTEAMNVMPGRWNLDDPIYINKDKYGEVYESYLLKE
ncbi:hypothetical protein KBA41_03645 [Candidatus Ozemobacteraceae bacterium]|nr:hypothetical protein [Candidatus Ozemobacteraceae bacterium]